MPDSEFSDQSHFIFTTASYGPEDLRVVAFDGYEGLSTLFQLRLTLVTDHDDLLAQDLVGKPATLEIRMHPSDEGSGHADNPDVARYFNGIISRLEHLSSDETGSADSYYQVEVAPLVWKLQLNQNSRIFQNKSVQEIVEEILKDAGLTTENYRFALGATYSKREYCVQHRESDWRVISRLLEDEGIFYFIEHNEKSHVLVMGDTPEVHVPIIGEASLPFRSISGLVNDEHIYRFSKAQQYRTGKVSLSDYDFRQPGKPISGDSSAKVHTELEHYDYHAQFRMEDGKTSGEEKKFSQVRLDEFQTRQTVARGSAVCHRLIAGSTFDLIEHPSDDANGTYLITHLDFSGSQPQAGQEGQVAEGEGRKELFSCGFECIPSKTPFRPPRVTPRPLVHGCQTAIVVGPSGEEIYTDEYGRIKVHFHWDRVADYDENASCWIRVSQGFAGGQYGSIFLPRVGQEVIISFVNGDPDQPIVSGRVYNADHMPPYTLPDEKTKSTIRTNSSTGGGGANELMFEDKAGSEQIFLHAQKDMHTRVLNDGVVSIGNDSHVAIGNDYQEEVKNNRSRAVTGEEAIEIGGARSLVVKGDVAEDFKGSENKEVGMKYHVKSGMEIVLESGMKLVLKGAGGFIMIDPGGVTIQGTMVKINSGGSASAAKAPKATAPAAPIEADEEKPGKDVTYTAQKGGAAATSTTAASSTTESTEEQEEEEKKSWVMIELKDENGDPCPGELYRVTTSDGKEIEGRLDVNGKAKVEGVEPGDVKVTYPELDKKEWE